MPLDALTFAFDPILRVSDSASVRLETIGLAIVLFVGLLVAARIGSVTPTDDTPGASGLRVDDLVFMVVGAVPGAIVGGRLGYVLEHLVFYLANPGAVLDPAQGALSLTLAVPLGILTGSVIARLLGAPVSRWMHALAAPLLLVLAGGKFVGVLGGSGQGAPSELAWATAYSGPGPWGSLAADVPSHPSQVYEAALVSVAIVVLAGIGQTGMVRWRNGAALYLGLLLWAAARFAAAFTWRDPTAIGSLNVEQVLLLGVALVAVVGLVERVRAGRRAAGTRGIVSGSASTEPPNPPAEEPQP